MVIIWIFVAILMFSIVVIIHELGHFFAARKFWVRVEEFGLGIPPKARTLWKDKKGTIYTLNWLPLWWFVKLTWESINSFDLYDENKKLIWNEELQNRIKEWKNIYTKNWDPIHKSEIEEISKKLQENEAEYNLIKKPVWQQSIIILAWIFMNFILAFVIFFLLFIVWVKPIWINDKISINSELKLIPTFDEAVSKWIIYDSDWAILSPTPWSVAMQSWLIEWDVIYEARLCKSKLQDMDNCTGWEEMEKVKIFEPQNLVDFISKNAWKEVLFMVNTENSNSINKPKNIAIIIPKEWKIGTYLWPNLQINQEFKYQYWPIDSAKYAFLETKNQVILTFKWIWYLVDKIFTPKNKEERKEAINSMSWPIWIVDFISNSLWSGVIFLMVFMAIISVNLWVFNLLPIPALDWWRFLFILLNWISEKLFWKKIIWSTSEAIVHFAFFVLLIALSLIIAYNDITKIFANN